MKCQAVILNLDTGRVDYVAPKDLPRPRKPVRRVVTGNTPPQRRPPE
jgi:hypothetical protein